MTAEAATYRDACLMLVGVVERQHRALELQALATRELSEGLKEASEIVSTLVVGDPSAALSLPRAHTESQPTSASDVSPDADAKEDSDQVGEG